LFLMGRSLGSIPAIELAFNYQVDISGLIIESGTADNFPRLWSQSGLSGTEPLLAEGSLFLNKNKIKQVKVPSLIIHGEVDELISVEEGKELYRNSAARDKSILIIPGADHNDVMIVDLDMYFGTIEEFVKTNG
ncbi:MAG: alpha/beta hydrolase, partial [Dehalococcoidales bacterium]